MASGARTLSIATDAVLARAEQTITPGVEEVINSLPVVVRRVYLLQADASRVRQLISALDEIYSSGQEELIEVTPYGLDFVPHPDENSWVNNSSTMIAFWAREMGITTIGWGLLANFRVTNEIPVELEFNRWLT